MYASLPFCFVAKLSDANVARLFALVVNQLGKRVFSVCPSWRFRLTQRVETRFNGSIRLYFTDASRLRKAPSQGQLWTV